MILLSIILLPILGIMIPKPLSFTAMLLPIFLELICRKHFPFLAISHSFTGNMENRQTNLTSSQVGLQIKNNPRKQVRWTENMDQVLVNGLLEIVLVGPKRTEKGFKAEEFTKVIDKVREACHVSVGVDNVRGRLRTLKKECDDITELFKTSAVLDWTLADEFQPTPSLGRHILRRNRMEQR